MRAGSYGHRSLFCEAFTTSHREVDVARIAWPELSTRALVFLRGIPFFGTALATERNAAEMLAGYAARVDDPVVRDAIALQGIEEARHGELLESFLNFYQIDYTLPLMRAPAPSRAEFYAFGYQESLETFLGWGVFAVAGKAQLFPSAFLNIFETLLADEARHLVFFSNYVAYERAREGRDTYLNEVRDTLVGYASAALHMAITFSGNDVAGPWFTQNNAGSILEGIGFRDVLEQSLAQYHRHMERVDPRLKRPRFIPYCADAALMLLRRARPRVVAPV